MNLLETVNHQMEAYSRVTTELLKWRPILVYSVLQVTPPSLIFKAMKETDEACRKPSESGLRQLLADTARQMGLQELPKGGESGGRPSAESCERYRREQAAPWILANGGMPRPEQLADPFWDLRPQRPSPSGFVPALPGADTSATAKNQFTKNLNQEPSGSQAQEESSIASPSVATGKPDQDTVSTEAPTNREARQKAIRQTTAGLPRNNAGEIIPPKSSGDLSSITVST